MVTAEDLPMLDQERAANRGAAREADTNTASIGADKHTGAEDGQD